MRRASRVSRKQNSGSEKYLEQKSPKRSIQFQFQNALRVLELLDIREGNHVIDISSSSINLAELISTMIGTKGSIVRLDIEVQRPVSQLKEKGDETRIQTFSAELFNWSEMELVDHVITVGVFHLVSSEDKVKLLESIFRSLKPGGTFAGNQIMSLSANVTLARKFLGLDQTADTKSMFYMEGREWLKSQFLQIGYEIVEFSSETYNINLGSLDNYLDCMSSTFYGRFDLKKGHTDLTENMDWLKFEDGCIKDDTEVTLFVVKKPIVAKKQS